MNRVQFLFLSTGTAALLAAGLASGGIGGTGRITGPASGKGSILVNGVKFETDAAMVYVNGVPGSDHDLKVGQIMDIEGSVDANGSTGVAHVVQVDDTIRGFIEAVDDDAGLLTVAGQAISVNGKTAFDLDMSDELEDLRVGDFVTVFAQFDFAADPHATRIERARISEGLRVTGDVDDLLSPYRLSVNGMVVDTSGALIDEESGPIGAGDRVRIDGMTTGSAGELLATAITRIDPQIGDAPNVYHSIEGLITEYDSFAEFAIDGLRVTTDAATVFATPFWQLGLDNAVVVEGVAQSDGSLRASIITALDAPDTTLLGTITRVDDDEIELDHSITIEFDEFTRFQDRSASVALAFGLQHLSEDDRVQVRVRADGDGYEGVFLIRETRGSSDLDQLIGWILSWFDGDDDEDDSNGED